MDKSLLPPPAPVPAAPKLWAGPSTPAVDPNASQMGKVIYDASVLLPKQGILENFVHHNPWEILQGMNFFEANEYIEAVQEEMSPGERLFSLLDMDPRLRTNEALSELCAVFLDRDSSKWEPPHRDKGFLFFFASLEGLGLAPWRKHSRSAARKVLARMAQNPDESSKALSEAILQENLEAFGARPEHWLSTTRSMLLDLPGWAGMFQRMQQHPDEGPANTKIELADFCAVQSILTRSSMESMAAWSGWDCATPLGSFLSKAPSTCKRDIEFLSKDVDKAAHSPSGLAYTDQNSAQREALEEEYERITLPAVGEPKATVAKSPRPKLQVFTCIDERECSIRRHLEAATGYPDEVETFGIPGFMSFQIYYKALDGREKCILGPEGCVPKYTLVEEEHKDDHEKTIRWFRVRRFIARGVLMWEKASLSPFGSLFVALLFPLTVLRLIIMTVFPDTNRRLNAFVYDTALQTPRTDFQLPCSPDVAAEHLAGQFSIIGVKDRFAPIAFLLGHGSRTVNNPFDAAHNCGACGGREGGPNARLMARFLNDKAVRSHLLSVHNISIPDDTWFVGGYHDTTSDLVELFDEELIPASFQDHFRKAKSILDEARGKNALERCEKLNLYMRGPQRTGEQALAHVHTRSTDLGEARPELGHATNASVIVGRRELTKGRFLARRAFLCSYDPFNDDDAGTNLEKILAPAIVVCSGISLEYLYSTTDGGAGTKLPLNLVGLAGVMQGTAGDLRVGLPTQMTDMHVPVRATFIIDAPPERLEAVLSRREELRQIVHNEWIRLVARDHRTKRKFRQSRGTYTPVDMQEAPVANIINQPRELEARAVEQPKLEDTPDFVSSEHHDKYGKMVSCRESLFTIAAGLAMLLSCGVLIAMWGSSAMHPRAPLVAVSGTVLGMCALAFSRRYAHADFMFGRFTMASAFLVFGFNLVAMAPTLKHALVGWNITSFASAFLIGPYNDQPTVRENVTFVFFIYQLSHYSLMVAAAFIMQPGVGDHAALAALGLVVAALLKSGQFPVTNLLMRSMEGPSPTSALAYAGLSAHLGVVLLAGTMPHWFGFFWARAILASVGLLSAGIAGLVCKIRADRKGALASATVSTLGLIYVVLAAGYADTALVLSLGHTTFRMLQFLRSPNFLLDTHNLLMVLHDEMRPQSVPVWLYKICWVLNRFNNAFQMPHVLRLFRWCKVPTPSESALHKFQMSKFLQWMLVIPLVVLAGMPFTPVERDRDRFFTGLLNSSHHFQAGFLMALDVVMSTLLMRFVFANVLDAKRFRHQAGDGCCAHLCII